MPRLIIVVKRLDTPWLAAFCVALIFFGVLAAQLAAHGGDVSCFINIGAKHVAEPDQLAGRVHVFPDSAGYDGQFYYQLALDPFSLEEVNGGLYIDNGPYRHQRIVYPLLVWAFSLGQNTLVPDMLVFVNYVGLVVIAWLGGRFAQMHGRHALWGTLFSLYPGFLFTLTRDLGEIVAAMFLLAAVVALERERSSVIPTLLLTLAVLTRETTLVFVIALGVTLYGSTTRWPEPRLTLVAVPLITVVLWQVALWAKWGRLPLLAGGENLGLPGVGLWSFVTALDLEVAVHRVWAFELGALSVVSIMAALVVFFAPEVPALYKIAWLGYGSMALCLTSLVWIEDLAFMRVLAEFYLLCLILSLAASAWPKLGLLGSSTIVAWLAVLLTRLDW
jgi:hypothetical protein